MPKKTAPVETTDATVIPIENPVALFSDEQAFDEFMARVKAETDKLVPDVTTNKGREDIRAMAYKVTRTKTAVDKAGKELTEDWRKKVAAINSHRTRMVLALDDLADKVRQPLTDYENAEAARVKACEDTIAFFRQASVVTIADTSESVAERGAEVWERQVDADVFRDLYDQAKDAKDLAVEQLLAAKERLEQEAADRAELARLRALEAQREAEAPVPPVEAAEAPSEAPSGSGAQSGARSPTTLSERMVDSSRAHAADAGVNPKTDAKEALMKIGLNEPDARQVVLAIVRGDVPYVEWKG